MPEPVTGGVYSEGLVGSIGRLNPIFEALNPADRDVNNLLYSSLIRHDSRGLPHPDLAESWGVSQDGTVYNFTLRPEVVWHDGVEVTSDDVIFTVEALRDPDSPLSSDLRELWDQIQVKQLNDKNLQFILPEPFAPFLDYLTFKVLPAHLVGHLSVAEMVNADFNLEPVGSGPYAFDHFLTESGEITGVVLRAFDDYYPRRPYIDQIVVQYYQQPSQALAAYQAGDAMGLSNVNPDVLPAALGESDLNLYSGRIADFGIIFLNLDSNQVPFLQDVTVREAMMRGLNRQKIIDRLLDGQAILATGPILPGTWAYFDGLDDFPYEPQKAISLLRNADYTIPAAGGSIREKDGDPLALELLHPDEPVYAAIAEEIQKDWAEIGIDVTPVPLPLMELIEDHLATGDYHAALTRLDAGRFPDPDPYPFWHEAQIDEGQNYSRWENRTASEYLEQARVINDINERARLYRNFQVLFNRELPSLPLFYSVYTYGVDQQVQGIRMGPVFTTGDRFQNVIDWFLLARRTVDEPTAEAVTP
ncbi:MAG: ABC transporter substrate-binding protein, partial [Anaerolineales bacterium]|nr:ABC transporter substrate-binding protein [Anaerolineales bacterium]